MTEKKSKPHNRSSKHMSTLAQRSNAARIKRHFQCEVFIDYEMGGKVPARNRKTDAGYDVFSPETVSIGPGDSADINLGIRVKCPPGYFYKIEARSSLVKRGLIKLTNPVIDATYSGPLYARLFNESGNRQKIEAGDRIAQLIFYPQFHIDFLVVTEFENDGRGEEGWGSSGK